jgi:hypothetical protein
MIASQLFSFPTSPSIHPLLSQNTPGRADIMLPISLISRAEIVSSPTGTVPVSKLELRSTKRAPDALLKKLLGIEAESSFPSSTKVLSWGVLSKAGNPPESFRPDLFNLEKDRPFSRGKDDNSVGIAPESKFSVKTKNFKGNAR